MTTPAPITRVQKSFTLGVDRTKKAVSARPFVAFIAVLVLLLAVIALSSSMRTTEPEAEVQAPDPVAVQVFETGQSPRLTMTGTVEKSGIFVVTAQTGGIVQKVSVKEGAEIKRGTQLVALSGSYTGGSTQTVKRQISARNYQFELDTYDLKKEQIAKDRRTAELTSSNLTDLREISKRSIDEAKSLLGINEQILSYYEKQLSDKEKSGTATEADLTTARKDVALSRSTVNGIRSSLRTVEYSSSNDTAPAQSQNNTREATLLGLDLREKMLDLNKDISALNLKMDRISESLLYPASTCAGIVEQIFVNVGESVSQGTPIALIRANDRQAEINVSVPLSIAKQVSNLEPAQVTINGTVYDLYPDVITTEAATGTLGNIKFVLPESVIDALGNNQTVSVSMPLSVSEATAESLVVPLDAIYQTATTAYVYTVVTKEDGSLHTQIKEVQVGEVSGTYVTTLSGLTEEDKVIVTRGVTADQEVTIQ